MWLGSDDSPRDAREQLVAHLADRAGVGEGSHVLDVGCGYGASSRWLALRRGCRVTGLTVSARQARYARRRRGAEAVHIVRGDATMLPFQAGGFDVVWVIECLEHLPDKRGFLEAVARMLRPEGRLALCSWQRGEAVSGEAPLLRAVCDAFLCPSLASACDYRDWCSAAGLQIQSQEDLTARVRHTWDILTRRVQRPWVVPLRWLVGGRVRKFVDGFPLIARAYDTGVMSYGLTVAVRR